MRCRTNEDDAEAVDDSDGEHVPPATDLGGGDIRGWKNIRVGACVKFFCGVDFPIGESNIYRYRYFFGNSGPLVNWVQAY